MPIGTEVGLGPGDIVLDGDPAPYPRKRGTAAPTFWPMSIVAKQSPSSATAELLSKDLPTLTQPADREKYTNRRHHKWSK